MSDDIYFEYPIVRGDTLGQIAQRFYGTCEDSLLQILKTINGLASIDSISEGATLKLPYFYQYGTSTQRPYTDQQYVFEIRQGASVLPVEFHHTELEGDPVAARRFIYGWRFRIPRFFMNADFTSEVLANLEEEADRTSIKSFYTIQASGPMSVTWNLKENLLNDSAKKEELVSLLKKAGYKLWQNRGLLMTDDWGQPWRIEEYINACREAGYFKYVASNYVEKPGEGDSYDYSTLEFEGENENRGGSLFFHLYDESFASAEHFAFYTPKEIAEIHFIEKAGEQPERCEENYYTTKANLDKREYFKPGDEYIFAFAPLDVLWARDEYVNIEKYPELRARNMEGASDADPLDYIQNVIKRTAFGEIVNHPPTYYTNGDWDPEKLVENGFAQKITIPEPEDGIYTKRAVKISLEPTIYEYISLLQKYTYEFEKSLMLHVKSSKIFNKLEMSLGEVENLVHLMEFYPNENDLDSKYQTEIDNYKERLEKFKIEINEKEVDSNFISVKSSLDHWLSAIPQKGKDAMELIKGEKPTEFIHLSEKLKKIEDFLDKPEFNTKLEDYLQAIESEDYLVEIDYFSFRHPSFTPVEVIANTYLLASQYPDDAEGERFYKKYIKPFESQVLSTYNDADQQEFHRDVTKSIMTHFRDFSLDVALDNGETTVTENVKMYSEAEGNGYYNPLELIEAVINDEDEFIDEEDQRNIDAGEPSLLSTIWDRAQFVLLTFSWNNQLGGDSTATKIIKAFQYFRTMRLVNGTNRIYQSVLARNYKLAMSLMARTYTGISRGIFRNVEVPNKRAIVRAYMEVAATDFYKNLFMRNNFVRRKPPNIGYVRNQLRRQMRALRNKINTEIPKSGGAAPWVTTGFSAFQLFASFQGIVDFFGKIGEHTWVDYVRLISSLSNGALALTGFHMRHVLALVRKFPRFRTVTLATTRTVIRHSAGIGSTLTIISLLADMVLCGVDAAWNHTTGDYFLMVMNIIRAALSGFGATMWIMNLFVPAVVKSIAVFLTSSGFVAAVGSLGAIGLVILVIMLLIMLIIWLRNQFKIGTQETMELFVNNVLKPAVEKVEKGSEFHDQTTLFNLASMWRIGDNNRIETFPPISPYRHTIGGAGMGAAMGGYMMPGPMTTIVNFSERVITYELKRTRLRFQHKNGAYNYGKLKYEPLNYRYSVPSLIFRGWSEDMIKKLHQTGWGSWDNHEGENDEQVMAKVDSLIDYWKERLSSAFNDNDEEAKTEIQYMKQILGEGTTLPDSFFEEMYL